MWQFFFLLSAGLVWMGMRGDLGLSSFAVGVVIGFILWRGFGHRSGRPFSISTAIRLAFLAVSVFVVFVFELILANLQQLRIVLAPRIEVSPHWLQFRTVLETPAMRAALSAMIIMTPGTVSYGEIEVDEGVWMIGVHALHAGDEAATAAAIERIRQRFETRLRRMEIL